MRVREVCETREMRKTREARGMQETREMRKAQEICGGTGGADEVDEFDGAEG